MEDREQASEAAFDGNVEHDVGLVQASLWPGTFDIVDLRCQGRPRRGRCARRGRAGQRVRPAGDGRSRRGCTALAGADPAGSLELGGSDETGAEPAEPVAELGLADVDEAPPDGDVAALVHAAAPSRLVLTMKTPSRERPRCR